MAPSVEIALKKTCIVQRPDKVVRNAEIPFEKDESGAAVGEEYGQLEDENRIQHFCLWHLLGSEHDDAIFLDKLRYTFS